jgi:hypothetical protein
MLVFLDTEFTSFLNSDLISLGLVTEQGEEFYGERNDYLYEDCTNFVRETVQPLLGRVDGARCSQPVLCHRLRAWFDALPELATIVFDYQTDWDLLIEAMRDPMQDSVPANLADKLLLSTSIENEPIFQEAYNSVFDEHWPPHHSLADARALRAGYLAWSAAQDK